MASCEDWSCKYETYIKRLQSLKLSLKENEKALVVQSSRLFAIMKEEEKIRSSIITGITNKVQIFCSFSYRDLALPFQMPKLPDGSEWT